MSDEIGPVAVDGEFTVVTDSVLSEPAIQHDSNATEGNNSGAQTLFVSGFPKDLRYREVLNLFRLYDGFVRADLSVNSNTGVPVSFITFESREQADLVMVRLTGLQFDPASEKMLRLAYAKANTSRKRSISEELEAEKRRRLQYVPQPVYEYQHHVHGAPPASGLPHGSLPVSGGGSYAVPPVQQQYAPPVAVAAATTPAYTPAAGAQSTTIFVGNMDLNADHSEVTGLFNQLPGFCRIRFGGGARGTQAAFVEFVDQITATAAKDKFTGHQLSTSVMHGGMRIEFAKSKMGRPGRQTTQQYGATNYGAYGSYSGY